MKSGIDPLLAHVYRADRVIYPCYVQPKLNGIRALYQNGHFQSREMLPFPVEMLRHLADPLKAVFDPQTILDGELYVHGWPLQRILSAVTPIRGRSTEDTVKVEYHVFDVVDFGKDFDTRFGNVQMQLLGLHPKVQGVWLGKVAGESQADKCYAECVRLGYEGMMYRLLDCPYTTPLAPHRVGTRSANPRSRYLSDQDNRVWHMLKRKDWQDDEFEFINLRETSGEKGGRGFNMTLKTKSGKFFDVSSGLTDSELDHFLSNPPVGRKVKVKYLVLSSDLIPLNATILAVL